jgi:GNAT superfamily N-acetyltransferase
MDSIRFGIDGYTLTRATTDADTIYVLGCMKKAVIASVDDRERALSETWMDTTSRMMATSYANQALQGEAFRLRKIKDNRDAGMIWVCRSKDQFTCEDTGYLLGIFVEESMRGRGLGSALLSAAEEWCLENDLLTLTINVGANNENAVHMYDDAGYEPQSFVMRRSLH